MSILRSETGLSNSRNGESHGTFVLGIETSTPWGGAALLESPGRLRGHLWAHARTGYSRRLMPGIDFLLRDAGLATGALSAIAVTHGPGSFTGVRIGLVTAKTLAQSLGIPLFTFCTLKALARRWPIRNEPIAVLMDARRKEIYGGVFQHRADGLTEVLRPTAVEAPERFIEALAEIEAPSIWLAGDAVDKYRTVWSSRLSGRGKPMSAPWGLPAAESVARMGAVSLASGIPSTDPREAVPHYIRDSDAWRGAAS